MNAKTGDYYWPTALLPCKRSCQENQKSIWITGQPRHRSELSNHWSPMGSFLLSLPHPYSSGLDSIPNSSFLPPPGIKMETLHAGGLFTYQTCELEVGNLIAIGSTDLCRLRRQGLAKPQKIKTFCSGVLLINTTCHSFTLFLRVK